MLVGLDWAEPMMFLFLHVTCSCIFHAYVPLFSSFDIDSVWYFFACLSLFPFLLDSLHMAPKRKTTLFWNPLHFGASSSSDSIPLHIKFYDNKARKDFSGNFSRRGIHLEC